MSLTWQWPWLFSHGHGLWMSLVNNTVNHRDKKFCKMQGEDWDAVIALTLTGLFNVTKVLLEKFNPAYPSSYCEYLQRCWIVRETGQTIMQAAKAGVIGMTSTNLGQGIGSQRFHCEWCCSGFIQTAMTKLMPKEVLEQMASKVPVQRLGETDICKCCFVSFFRASSIHQWHCIKCWWWHCSLKISPRVVFLTRACMVKIHPGVLLIAHY